MTAYNDLTIDFAMALTVGLVKPCRISLVLWQISFVIALYKE